MTAAAGPALRLQRFSLAFVTRDERRTVLKDCDLEVPRGGFYLLIGRSGAGKSTILRWLTGLFDPRATRMRTSGRCQVLGEAIEHGYPGSLRHRVAAVLQDEGLLDDLSPRENVELALDAADRPRVLAIALLSQAGLDPPPERVADLSGGMRKRVGVARGLAADPELFLFDEPTAGLDARAARQLAELLATTHAEASPRRTTIVITHDLAAFAGIAGGILRIDAERQRLVLEDPGDPARPESVAALGLRAEPHGRDPVLEASKHLVGELGSLTHTLVESVIHLPPAHLRRCAGSVVRCLVEPAFFVALGTMMVGFLATFFALRNSPLEGAFEDQIVVGVGKVLVSVLGPLVVGFFFTARMAAGAAARIGTMKRTNQVAALQMMGIRPADYLLVPLLWGFALAMPGITLGAITLCAMASLAAASLVSGIQTVRWAEAFFLRTDLADVRFILLKTLVSGFLVAVWTYHLATGPKRSGEDVGESVNASIVAGMLTVLAVHGLFTLWQFA